MELLQKLDDLKISGRKRKRDVPATWVRGMRETGDIERIQSQLQRCHKLLDTEMLSKLW